VRGHANDWPNYLSHLELGSIGFHTRFGWECSMVDTAYHLGLYPQNASSMPLHFDF